MTESFKELLEESGFFELNYNQTGINYLPITKITPKHLFVEAGMKSQGCIPTEELKSVGFSVEDFEVGQEIPVFVDSYDNGYGQPILSYTKARQELNKEDIQKSLNSKDFFLEVVGSHPTKVGIVAKYYNTEIFIPYTLLGFDFNSKEFYDEKFIGQKFKVKVIKADFQKNHIVSSHKAYLEKEKGLSFDKLIESLEVGQTYEVPLNSRKFKPYGVFTSLNHIDTLLKSNDIGWKSISDPADFFNSGERSTQVVLTDIDLEKERISISHKLANTQPWDDFIASHNEGDVLEVEVVAIKEDYILVRHEDAIDFILHQNEISNQDISGKLELIYSMGEKIQAKIKQIDHNNYKINLSVKQLNEDSSDFVLGDVVEGKVISKSDNGIKVSYQHMIFWISKFELTEFYNQREVMKGVENGSFVKFKIISTDKGSLKGSLVLESTLDQVKPEKGETVQDWKVASLQGGKIMVEHSIGFKGFVNLYGNLNINPSHIFQEGDIIEDLIFKSVDKNNYFHFDLHIDHDNEFKNPTIGDLIK